MEKTKSLAERMREAMMKDVHEQSALMEAAAAGEDPNAAAARIIGGDFNFCEKTAESIMIGELTLPVIADQEDPEVRFMYLGAERTGRIIGTTEGDKGTIHTIEMGSGITVFGVKAEDVLR